MHLTIKGKVIMALNPARFGILILCSSAAALFAAQGNSAADEATLSHPLHFDVNLVQVDVVVTDSHGQRVPDLKSDDFEVLQDGKPQKITHFLYVSGGDRAPVRTGTESPVARPLARNEVRRVFLIYIDDREMSFADFTAARKALRRFIDEDFQAGDVCAFYRTSGGPGAWRAFSNDPQQARAALEHLTWMQPPPMLRGPMALKMGLRRAIAALGAMPGRKALVLVNSGVISQTEDMVSPVFPISRGGSAMAPPQPIVAPGTNGAVLNTIARQVADEANRVSAVIYAIDSRGLK